MRPNQAERTFAELEYPVTSAELIDELGDIEIDLPIGTESIGDVFARVGSDTYIEPGEAYSMFMSGLSSKAIGRKGYSDRDPPVVPSHDTLLSDESRFEAGGPHCGICQHVELVGDWDVVAYCDVGDELVEPVVGDVCPDFETVGWSYTRTGEGEK